MADVRALGAAAGMARIRINECDEELLKEVPHIKDARARTIIQHRATHGPFTSIDQIAALPGFNQGIAERIRPFISLSTGAFRDERSGVRRRWRIGLALAYLAMVAALAAIGCLLLAFLLTPPAAKPTSGGDWAPARWWQALLSVNLLFYATAFFLTIVLTCHAALARRLARVERLVRTAQIAFVAWCTGILLEMILITTGPYVHTALYGTRLPSHWWIARGMAEDPFTALGEILQDALAVIGLVLVWKPRLAFGRRFALMTELVAIGAALLWCRWLVLFLGPAVSSFSAWVREDLWLGLLGASVITMLFVSVCGTLGVYAMSASYRLMRRRLTLGRFLREIFGLVADLRHGPTTDDPSTFRAGLEVLNGHAIRATPEQARKSLNDSQTGSSKAQGVLATIIVGTLVICFGDGLIQLKNTILKACRGPAASTSSGPADASPDPARTEDSSETADPPAPGSDPE